jgi:hypothetical protein
MPKRDILDLADQQEFNANETDTDEEVISSVVPAPRPVRKRAKTVFFAQSTFGGLQKKVHKLRRCYKKPAFDDFDSIEDTLWLDEPVLEYQAGTGNVLIDIDLPVEDYPPMQTYLLFAPYR